MSEKNNKRHHYVPQCYLKSFSSNGKSLWVYNKHKQDNKIYQQAISNICYKNDFYSVENLQCDGLFIEKEFFSKSIEPQFSNMLKSIIDRGIKYQEDKISEVILTPVEKYQFAFLMSIQWFRTPYQQHNISQLSQDIMSLIIPKFNEGMALETGDDSYRDLDVRAGIDPVVGQAKMGYMDEESLDRYAKALMSNYWEFFITPEDYVYTSDFPITVKMHIPDARPMFEGLACYGSELIYPISKNICLTIWDKEYFSDKKVKDSHFTDMTGKDLIHFNVQTYAYANQVYCCEDKFELLMINSMIGEEFFGFSKNR